MRSRWLASTVFSLLLALLMVPFASCGGEQKPEIQGREFGPVSEDFEVVEVSGQFSTRLSYPLAGEPETFNPAAASDARSKTLAYLTSGTLLEFDGITHEIRLGLAKSLEVLDEGKVFRLKLREGLRFSDGQPFSADDVVFTFARIYEEASNNALKDTLLLEGEPLQVRKLGDYEVEIGFPKPYAAGHYILSTVPILPRHLLGAADRKLEEFWTLDTSPGEMAGLGPYVISSHEPGRRTVLTYNPQYWRVDRSGLRLPYFGEVSLEYLPDRNTQILRLKAGELDLMDQLLRPQDLLVLEGDKTLACQDIGPSSNLAFFWVNLSEPNPKTSDGVYRTPQKAKWFSRTLFRQALSRAISREALVKNVYQGGATEAVSFVPPSNRRWFATDLETFGYDPSRARELLLQAGFKFDRIGSGEVLLDEAGQPVRFEILTRSDSVLGQMAAIIQQDLGNLGIAVSIRQEEFRTVISRIMGSRDYDAVVMNLDFPIEPSDMANVLVSSGSMHFWNPGQEKPATAWEADVDGLMERQAGTLDQEERFALFREVQSIFAREVPIVPLVNRNLVVAASARLENVRPAMVFPYALFDIWAAYAH